MSAKIVPINKNGIGPIESNVPAPPVSKGGARAKYPWAKMKVGQSFTAPKELQNSVRNSANIYGKRNNMTFTCRVEGNRVRIWRIK